MPAYYYSSTAGSYTLTGDVSPSATILVINTVSGLPSSTPFKVVVDAGQPSEEIVKVTAVAGTSLTVVRGWDGTSGADHAAGAVVRHMVTAEDFTLSRTHEDATAAHGATGAVVGTINAQTISNKDLSNGTNVFPAALVTLTGAQTLTNKTLTTPTLNAGPTIKEAVFKGNVADTATIFSVRNNAGTDLLKSEPNALNVSDHLKVYYSTGLGAGKVLEVSSPSATTIPLYVRANAAQSSSLIEVRSSDDLGTLFRVSSTGAVTAPNITDMQYDIGALEIVTADSGTISSGVVTAAAGFTIDTQLIRKASGWVDIQLDITRTGADIASSSTGNIVNVGIGTVAAGYRPMGSVGLVVSRGGQAAGCYIQSNGTLGLNFLPPNVAWGTGDLISFSATYFAAN